MRNDEQFAITLLRLLRKEGLHCTLLYEDGIPMLKVGPKALLATRPYLRAGLTRAKAALVALLQAEGHGTCTAADGTEWHQTLARCPQCGASDWGVVGQTADKHGMMAVHGCLTCATPLETLTAQVEEAIAEQVDTEVEA